MVFLMNRRPASGRVSYSNVVFCVVLATSVLYVRCIRLRCLYVQYESSIYSTHFYFRPKPNVNMRVNSL